jgi:hypothetical protein
VPPPRFDDIRRFCELDGWTKKATARRGEGDHTRYEKRLTDGSILRTKASHSNAQIGDRSLWRHIWRDQLGLESEDEFWRVLETGQPAARPGAEPEPPEGPSLPAWLVDALIRQAGIAINEVRGLSEQEARDRLHEFWSTTQEGTTD